MHRQVWVGVVLVVLSSGCYTVLRHPAVDDSVETDPGLDWNSDHVALVDCSACHVGWVPETAMYPPRWEAYYADAWWLRGRGEPHDQGVGMANDRPPLLVPVAATPVGVAPVPIAPTPPPVQQAAPSPPANEPSSGARSSQPAEQPRAGRSATPVESPRPPDAGTDEPPAQPAPPVPARQGQAIENDRSRPKP